MLKLAALVDGKLLSDTGVDVVFARAKARHPGAGRQVPYRIFLGALSLTAGHLVWTRGAREGEGIGTVNMLTLSVIGWHLLPPRAKPPRHALLINPLPESAL